MLPWAGGAHRPAGRSDQVFGQLRGQLRREVMCWRNPAGLEMPWSLLPLPGGHPEKSMAPTWKLRQTLKEVTAGGAADGSSPLGAREVGSE